MREAFPFSAIVGQEEMKLALMATAVDPAIGGVLVFGDRGTGKSTAVRSLAALLPSMSVVKNCRYGCQPDLPPQYCDDCRERYSGTPLPSTKVPVPVVDLPLGATEDRVVGALDLERALTEGVRAFEPGLLARANRGYLYIDEVNLLDDHLVDLLIDVAASGENVVERDGLSVRHPARFVLIGSGNPEEGELRPQLLDRFGLSVEVRTPVDVPSRIEIIRRRDEYERQGAVFNAHYHKKNLAVRKRILAARERLASVVVDDTLLGQMSRLCVALGTDGLRGELTLMRASRAVASLAGRAAATMEDLCTVAAPALRHRLRRDPLDESGSTERIDRALAELKAGARGA